MSTSTLKATLKETWYLLVALLVIVVFATRMYLSEKREEQDLAETVANSTNFAPFRPASLPEPTRRITKEEQTRGVIERHQERLEKKPDANESASLLQAMGNLARMKLGEYEEAASYYETVLSTYPDWKGIRRTYTNLAVCYERLGDELRAQSVYKRMMKAFPEDSQEYQFAKSELGL
ncbi:MAG: tetratricopeptide repeat protein [Nitrospiraceae bacterium]|nr:tetratricopeptide repeat protein [Nitrospiraceae bacterium]